MSNVLNESAENYLETILILSQKLPVVRSVDIANELGFKKSSVSVAMKNLREKEHIKVDEQGFNSFDTIRPGDCKYDLRTPHTFIILADTSRRTCGCRCCRCM